MLDQSAIFLSRTRQKTRYVHERNDWNVEGVAEPHESCALARGIAIKHAGKHHRLIGEEPHRSSSEATKANNDVFGKTGLELKKIALINHLEDQLLDVIGLIWVVGNQGV